jgi:CRISPR-associated endoribonuclease Cas6
MRIFVKLYPKKSKMLIPFDHQYLLASCIYNILCQADSEYASLLHESTQKFFTFSYLMAKNGKPCERGIHTNGELYFSLSSPDKRFIANFVEGIFALEELRIGKLACVVEELRILRKPEFNGTANFRTLSPILIRKPIKKNGKLRGEELYPNDAEFAERMVKNLKKKYEAFYGKSASRMPLNLEFKHFKPKRHKILDTYHRCVLADFKALGAKELIEFGYETGFGEKNSMGFGMVKVV